MEEAIIANFTPLQMFLALALQIWIFVIFPIIVIRKINYLTALVQSSLHSEDGAGVDTDA